MLARYFATCRGRAPCRPTKTVITAENNRMRFDVSVLMLKSVEHYLWAGTGHGPYALIIFLLVIRRIYNYLKKFHYLIKVGFLFCRRYTRIDHVHSFGSKSGLAIYVIIVVVIRAVWQRYDSYIFFLHVLHERLTAANLHKNFLILCHT